MATNALETFDTEALLRENAEKLKSLLDSVQTNGSGEHESTIKAIARISQAITATCGELRQHAKARAKALAEIPLEQLVAYLKTLPNDTKRDVCRELLGDGDEAPLL